MFVYCSDREKARDLKEDIERDTGVKVKRVIRSLDKIKDEGLGIFIYDDNLDLDYDFKDTDIVVSLSKMNFNDWVAFNKRGVDIVDCSEGFGDIAWRLVYSGIEGSKANDRSSRAKLEEKKYELKDYFRKSGSSLINITGNGNYIGKSKLCLNLANIIKKTNPTKRVLVIDRVKGFTGLNYFVKNHSDYEKVDTNNSQLGDEIYRDKIRDVFVLSTSNDGKVYTDVGVTDIISVVDNIKRHFDIILVDTDNLIDSDYMTIYEICTENIVVTKNNNESVENTIKKLDYKEEINKEKTIIALIVEKDINLGNTHDKLKTYGKIVEVPNDMEDAKQKDSEVYLVSDSSDFYKAIQNLNNER